MTEEPNATRTPKDPATVLLVDDNPTNLQVLFQTLNTTGHKLLVAKSGEAALEIARKTHPDLILCDIMMPPGIDGYETCRRLKEDPETRESAVIFLSALDDVKDKVRGLKAGAVDYITKPFQADEVLARVETHLTIHGLKRDLQSRNEDLARELRVAQELLNEARKRVEGPLLGESPVVQRLREAIQEQAEGVGPLLLQGPRGSGMESVARAIHHASARRRKAFLNVNCAFLRGASATSAAVLDDTLSATESILGDKLRVAAGGTLFLFELNRLPMQMQEELADFLEEAEADDGSDEAALDVRLITSISKDPDEEMREGRLDSHLHRLLVGRQLTVPPLADRREDVPVLAEHYVKRQARLLGKTIDGVAPDSLQRLQEYRWPGNVDELRQVVERASITSRSTVLEVDESLLEEGIAIGSYRLIERLGVGGMGEVWLAKHQLLARPAAIKLIRAEVLGESGADGTVVERFKREATATANLRSPHSVQLYDYGVDEAGSFYYVMEHLLGMDLRTLVDEYGPVPAERAVYLLRQACMSLAEAHAAGLVHRDIKPANLFLCKQGLQFDFVKVLDFGIVKNVAADDVTNLTMAGAATGTPSYMAPEMVMSASDVDARADLYALGCVAYWLLTGKTVFEGENAIQIMMHHAQTPARPPSEQAGVEVPPVLDELVLSSLAKKPEERPGGAQELWEMLGRIQFAEPWTEERARDWWREHVPDIAG